MWLANILNFASFVSNTAYIIVYKYGQKSNAAFRECVAFSACKVPLEQLFERSVSCLLNFDSYPLQPYFYSGSKKNPTSIPINPHNRTYKLINVIRILKLCWRPVGDIRLFLLFIRVAVVWHILYFHSIFILFLNNSYLVVN